MAKQKKVALQSVLGPDENIYWQGKPEKIAFALSELKDDIIELTLRILFDLILIPILFINTNAKFGPITFLFLVVLYLFHLKPILDILSRPATKLLEWKNTYYIITDKNIYIQFGINHIYYRAYPVDRIGTKVFYRKNKIDITLLVGTIGFSVDDYYEERFISIKDYEDVYKVLRSFASAKKEQLQNEMIAERARQEELLKQQELLKQSEELQKQQEVYQDLNTDEYEFESYDSYKRRMQEEEMNEKLNMEKSRQEELEREREHEELINKYNEYRKRHEAAAQQKEKEKAAAKKEEGTSVTLTYNTADDSGIEDGAEIEFPVNIPQQPKRNKKGKAPKKSNKYEHNPSKRKPPVEYGGINGPAPKTEMSTAPASKNNNSDDEDIDMSLLWGSLTNTNSDE